MRGKFITLLFILIFSAASFESQAQILSGEREQIIFSPDKIPNGVTWSRGFSLKESGLETQTLPANQSHDLWIQTHAFPIGMSWRPPASANFRIYFDGSIVETESSTYSGVPRVYIRYSSDKIHWSTWYRTNFTDEKTKDGLRIYRGEIALPQIAREKYSELMQEWWKTKPAWSSDEHEFCEWLIRKEPDFFKNEFPFIGYVQVRLEKIFVNAAQDIKSMTIESNWGTSGLSSPPRDKEKTRKNTGDKWFFTGKINQ